VHPKHPTDRNETVAVLMGAAILVSLQIAGLHGVRFDDAFITFRYGQNLALGRGLVFNPGDHLLGTTSPGSALLSALVYAAVGRELTPDVMAALGCVGWTAEGALTFFLLRGAVGRGAAVGAALALGAGLAGSYEFVLLETNLVTALILAGFLLALHERWLGAGAVLGAAVVFRPDAAIACAAFLSYAGWRLRSRALRPAAAMAAVSAPWLAFATYYYGSPIPHTLGAKAQHVSLAEYALHIARLPASLVGLGGQEGGVPAVVLLLAWALALHGAWVLVKRDGRLAILVAAGVCHALAYLVLRPLAAFTWHLHPTAVLVATCAVVGAASLASRAHPYAAAAASAALMLLPAFQAISFSVRHVDELWFGRRYAVQREVAEYLRTHGEPSDVFDAEEVGTVAYYSDLRASDHPGLVTREPRTAHTCARSPSCAQPRWLVMNELELGTHAVLCQGCGVVAAGEGHARLFIADRASIPR
jgi:arabinofuranosyltransferase